MMSEDVSPSEAARRIGATTRSVQRWIATGRLPARRVGGRWRVASDALDAILGEDRGTGTPLGSVGPTGQGRVAGGSRVARAPIATLFIANRGEIATRIQRTCQELGIRAVVPETDGPDGLDLLDVEAVVGAATAAGADALHPGFGFLAEHADFAAAVIDAGIRWIGPPPQAIRAMGDKAAARRLAQRLGIPTVAGYDGDEQDDPSLIRAAARIGYPLLVKPAAGGGGKGMRVVPSKADLATALAAARREAMTAFGDDRVILERYLEGPRHVEVQLLFDGHGNGVHLGERDCSLQRRHQKVLEETPSPAVRAATREALTSAALALAREVGYVSAGTCEFLLDDTGSIFFLEMNTRLQVEHPVTELVTGRDLVADQIRIAAGEPFGFTQRDARPRGHAVEVRLYAEDAEAGFLPSTGPIVDVRWPSGDGIRVDAGITRGDEITGRFDPMLAKIVAWGANRREALERLRQALDQTVVLGLTTNLAFLRWLVRQPTVVRGNARIDTLASIWPPAPGSSNPAIPEEAWTVAARALGGGGWRLNAAPVLRLVARGAVGAEDQERTVAIDDRAGGPDDGAAAFAFVRRGDIVHVDVGGRSVAFEVAPPPDVDAAARAAAAHQSGSTASDVIAPMPGLVLAVHVAVGDEVRAGDPVVTLEAMKMEHVVAAGGGGRLASLDVRPGDQVTRGRVLATIT